MVATGKKPTATSWLVLAGVASAVTRLVIGCDDDVKNAPVADANDAASSKDTEPTAPAALEPMAIDAGCARIPNPPCRFHCTEYATPGKLTSQADGGVAWTIGNGANVTLKDGEESAFLDATEFGIDLSDDKVAQGVVVAVTRRAEGPVVDSHLTLLVTNAKGELPIDHRNVSPWPKTQTGVHHYAQCTDTFNVDLNPVDVRKPSFGARLAVKRGEDAGTIPVSARVESIQLAVCYCNADGR